ncbi:WG repeat-containing protein [Paenibacillus hemerocallicola]|uniref:WG repeat-containing protein n=1 Tax=Paenibacillus hemerocallicola TaxID=1172614 RepID=UPI001C40349B
MFVFAHRFQINRTIIGIIDLGDDIAIQKGSRHVQRTNKRGTISRHGPNYTNGKWGYIDKNGDTVVPLRYDHAGPFEDGLATVMTGGSYGLIDKSGKSVAAPPKSRLFVLGQSSCQNQMTRTLSHSRVPCSRKPFTLLRLPLRQPVCRPVRPLPSVPSSHLCPPNSH